MFLRTMHAMSVLITILVAPHLLADQPPTSQPATTQPRAGEANPAAPGFNAAASDPRAMALADSVMAAMGGRQAWDETRYLVWRFFGRRLHFWDKHTGDIRVEWGDPAKGENTVVLTNLHHKLGRAWVAGEEVIDDTKVAELLGRAHQAWINDSYWLVMPYKLKDSGVTLAYKGETDMADGRPAEVITLTFSEVGATPQNKYDVFVARDSGLIEQWSFYGNFADATPRFTGAWHNWKTYGRIKLSDNRGDRTHTDVGVYDVLPRSVFTSPDPVDLEALDGGV